MHKDLIEICAWRIVATFAIKSYFGFWDQFVSPTLWICFPPLLWYFSEIMSSRTHTNTRTVPHIAPGVPGAPTGPPTGAPTSASEGKTGDSNKDSGKGNVNAVPDRGKTLPGQDTSYTDSGSNENQGGNKKIVPGQMFSPSLYPFLSLSFQLSVQRMSRSCVLHIRAQGAWFENWGF